MLAAEALDEADEEGLNEADLIHVQYEFESPNIILI